MKGKSFLTFSRRMVRANARRQAALSHLSARDAPSEPAALEVRIEPFLATGIPLTYLTPEEIEIRVNGALVALEALEYSVAGHSGRRGSGHRNATALLEEPWTVLEARPVPSRSRAGEAYRDLRAAEKRRMAIDLVAGGDEARGAREAARLTLLTLAGRVTGPGDSSPWRMRFEPSWPAGLDDRELDLYNVMLSPGGEVLVFERRQAVAGEHEGLEVSLEGEGERVWGIVAIDPETGRGWLRRLAFRVPQDVAERRGGPRPPR